MHKHTEKYLNIINLFSFIFQDFRGNFFDKANIPLKIVWN